MAGGIVEHLRARCARRPDGTATVGNQACRFPRMTYSQVFEAADDLAAGFLDFGVRHGDHVGVVSENLDLWILTDLALLSIGAATVPRGGDASPAEIGFCLKHGGCRIAVFENAGLIAKAAAELPP